MGSPVDQKCVDQKCVDALDRLEEAIDVWVRDVETRNESLDDLATVRSAAITGWLPHAPGVNPVGAAVDRVEAEMDELREQLDGVTRRPTEAGGPGKEEAYWMRQKLQASIGHLRDIEDYFRVEVGGEPGSYNMARADRARSLYEQMSEDFINGRLGTPTMRERAEAAEAENQRLRDERDAANERAKKLNRRATQAEAVVTQTVDDCRRQGVSVGRALANSACSAYEARAEAAEAEVRRLTEGLRRVRASLVLHFYGGSRSETARIIDALLAASPPDGEGYRERPIEEDFYLDPKGEWVYRWNDERWVLRSPPDKSADFDNCPDEDWGETDGGGA